MDKYIKLLDLAEKRGIMVYVGKLSNKDEFTCLVNNNVKIILLKENSEFEQLTKELEAALKKCC
jgi:hypothetical protein